MAKFTPTSKFLSIARSLHKVIRKKVYCRKTSTLTTALNTGTWTDVTRFIDVIPEVDASIEKDLGVFNIDSVPLTAKNIAWMAANVFNASASEYIEFKIEFHFGFASDDMATDTVYYFSGYVDKDTIVPGEAADAYTFTVDSHDALMKKMDAASITTQYYEPVQAGTALINIPGVYVTDCNIASYVLSPGIHTVAYDYNGGAVQARLNDGMWVPISGGGTFTLGDGETTADDLQRITIKVVSTELQAVDETREENIVIATSGTTLPETFYTGIPVRDIAKKIYDAVGITTQTIATLQTNTFDGTSKNVSFLGYINDGVATADIGYSYAIAVKNSTTLFVASGNRIYSFNPVTGVVTYLVSVTAGYTVSKMMYNSRNDHLWILFGNSAVNSYGNSLARYDVAGASLSATITVTDARPFSIELFDFQYFGGSYEYSLIYPSTTGRNIKRVDGATMAVTTLFANTDLGYTGSNGPINGFAYQSVSSGTRLFRFFATDTGNDKIHEIGFETTAGSAWADDGIINTAPPFAHDIGAYVSTDDRVFAFDPGTNDIRKYAPTAASATDVITLDNNDVVQGMYSDGTYCFFTTKLRRYFHYVNNAGINTVDINVYSAFSGFYTGNSRTYGIDQFGRVFQFHTVIERFIDRGIFAQQTLKDALTATLRGTNCISTMSFAKSAIVYPRGDASGAPVTAGNQITVTVSNIKDIEKIDKYGKAYDVVALDNGKKSINYDGTNYNVLPATLNQRVLTVRSPLIPSNVIKDYTKNFYEYFSVGHTLYTVPVLQPLMHIEPVDGATLNLTTTKITSSAADKPIYSVRYRPDGTMKISILV